MAYSTSRTTNFTINSLPQNLNGLWRFGHNSREAYLVRNWINATKMSTASTARNSSNEPSPCQTSIYLWKKSTALFRKKRPATWGVRHRPLGETINNTQNITVRLSCAVNWTKVQRRLAGFLLYSAHADFTRAWEHYRLAQNSSVQHGNANKTSNRRVKSSSTSIVGGATNSRQTNVTQRC